MHKKLRCYTVWGIIFASIAGTLLHFAYSWSGDNFLIGLIAPVNESIWEHMKLIFFPTLIYTIFCLYKLNGKYPCAASGFSFGLLLGTFMVPVLFYTYTGILGFDVPWMDIAVFILCIIIAFVSSYYMTINCCLKEYKPLLLFLFFIVALVVLFVSY